MPTAKPSSKGATVHLVEPKRFAAVSAALTARGLKDLPLSSQVRIVIDEWLKQNGK